MEMRFKCPECKLLRYPEEEIVKKGRKAWLVITCRVCGYKDLRDIKAEKPKDD